MAQAKSDTGPNIAQRINAVQKNVDYIQREEKEGMRYKIVSHDAVTELVRKPLVEAGVLYYPLAPIALKVDGNRTEAVFTVRFENIDDREDYIDVGTMGFGVDKEDKGPGKAISYGVKYALLKALGLQTGDDPDHESIPHRSNLDNRLEQLELAISTAADVLELTALMNDPATGEIMKSVQQRNAGEWQRMRAVMSKRMKALKAAAQPTPEEKQDESQ